MVLAGVQALIGRIVCSSRIEREEGEARHAAGSGGGQWVHRAVSRPNCGSRQGGSAETRNQQVFHHAAARRASSRQEAGTEGKWAKGRRGNCAGLGTLECARSHEFECHTTPRRPLGREDFGREECNTQSE